MRGRGAGTRTKSKDRLLSLHMGRSAPDPESVPMRKRALSSATILAASFPHRRARLSAQIAVLPETSPLGGSVPARSTTRSPRRARTAPAAQQNQFEVNSLRKRELHPLRARNRSWAAPQIAGPAAGPGADGGVSR